MKREGIDPPILTSFERKHFTHKNWGEINLQFTKTNFNHRYWKKFHLNNLQEFKEKWKTVVNDNSV